MNRVRMRSLEEEGNKRAARVNKILDNYSKMISTILIGNNIVNLTASSLATTLAMRINLAVGIATGILTIVVLLCGEIVPKTWAVLCSEKLALSYCNIIYLLMQVLTPVIIVVDLLSHGIMKLLHIDPNKKASAMTESELKTYVDVSHEDGVIESEERKLIYNVFDFSDAHAKDIMIPRINMVTVSLDATYDDVLAVFRDSMYTRLPVYEDDKDNIIGLINIKDFILTEDQSAFHVGNILRDAYYTYEYKKIADLMYEMREKTTNVSFVLNEYGATVGMITLEDLLEEIVGEIRDEYDEDEEELKAIFERTFGPVKRYKEPQFKRTFSAKSDSGSYYRNSFSAKKKEKEYLLVDGYNIIYAWEDLKELADANLHAAQTKLMDILSNYQGFKKCTLILVFDAYKIEGHAEEVITYHNIHVVYTKEAETADQYIEKTVHKIGRENQVTVATSDGLEQIIIMGQGAHRMSARGLRDEIKATENQIRQQWHEKRQSSKNYLIDNISDEMAQYMKEKRLGK